MAIFRDSRIKKKYIVLNGLLAVVLLSIIVTQAILLDNMYDLYQRKFKANADEMLKTVTYMKLSERGEKYTVTHAYFDYLDLVNDTLIYSNKPEGFVLGHYLLTDTIPFDIANSIGLLGYVENPQKVVLDKMKIQLMFSILLIAFGVVSLFFISRSYVLQLKTEKMCQDSVNVMTHEFKRPISGVMAMVSTTQYYIEKENIKRVLMDVDQIIIELNKLTHYTKRIQQISNNEAGKVMLDKSSLENILLFPVLIVMTVTDTNGGGLQISIKDNGIGISATDRKNIFDKYYLVKRGETKNKTGFAWD